MQKTTWLLFDLGGVLFDFHGAVGVSNLTGLSTDAAHELLVKSQAVHALETGEIGPKIFGQRLADELGLALSSAAMVEEWVNWLAGPKPGTIELLETVRDRWPIACLTNNNSLHWARLSMLYETEKLFDKCYLSHEIGLHKPDPRIFQHVVEDLGAHPADITYFDDRADIVESALACGLNAHQATSPEDIRAVIGPG